MKRRVFGYVCWLIVALSLYFFENNTGTRILLLCSLLFPLVPQLRGLFFSSVSCRKTLPEARGLRPLPPRETEEPDGVRAWLPGDPAGRIHWKLSAKRGQWLTRQFSREAEPEETIQETAAPAPDAGKRRLLPLLSGGIALLALLLLGLIPEANRGAQALLNRLYEASEAVNAYAYARFPVAADQPVLPALCLLVVLLVALLMWVTVVRSRLPALLLMISLALLQCYFGLPLPGWIQVLLFAFFALRMAEPPLSRSGALRIAATVLACALAVVLIWPGVDARTEEASERVRDQLSRWAAQSAEAPWETPEGETEVRRAHTRSLVTGEGEARADREFRLVSVEEEQISLPHWVNVLKIALLLLLTVAVLILPFLPFLLLNARRKKALKAREVFQSACVSEAVCAIFRQVVAWLDVLGKGAGNLPFTAWAPRLAGELTPAYAERFHRCAGLFEEAAYSNHTLREADRQQALELLRETEGTLWPRASRKQRLILKYRECLRL